jgi:HD superfamily phosphodiesterase
MNLIVNVESAENILKQILEEFFVSVYDEDSLPSHGLSHHRRVWNNARQLIAVQSRKDLAALIDPRELLIACYLHDIGMSEDPGTGHGLKSRKICESFLEKNNITQEQYPQLLHTIEYHDRKEYNTNLAPPPLLTLLSVADDLDAFGYIGIYRYAEIYLARGIEIAGLGEKVMRNAQGRFSYFLREFGEDEQLLRLHTKRHNILQDFFAELNTLSARKDFRNLCKEGHCLLLRIIKNMFESGRGFSALLNELEAHSNDPVILQFLTGLNEEQAIFRT